MATELENRVGRYYVAMRSGSRSDRYFVAMLAAGLIPVAATVFALTRAAHDIGMAVGDAPAPVAGLCRQAVVYTLDPFAHATYAAFALAAVVAVGVAYGIMESL